MKNYYEILNLQSNASQDEIKSAYRRLAKHYHPDVNKAPEAHEKFCEITEAYDFLINHLSSDIGQYGSANEYDQKYREYEQTEVFRKFRQEAQERARRQARMRYEKFKKQHDAFQESGLNDIGLVFTIFLRVFSLVLFLFLSFTPVILSFAVHWTWIFVAFFMWPFALGLGWYYHDNRKNYFFPGTFYYSFKRIKQLYTTTNPTAEFCYYSSGKSANSRPFKIDLFKQKDIKMKVQGFRQYNVNYINDDFAVSIPRSRKAFLIHSINALLKILTIVVCLITLDISSIVWRIIIGLIAGGIITRIILILFNTRSNTSYLFSLAFICRLIIWTTGICLASVFLFKPFDICTTDSIQFVLVSIMLFDSLIMQLFNLLLGKNANRFIFRQYQLLKEKVNEGYRLYNDIPVVSVFYPLFKWFVG